MCFKCVVGMSAAFMKASERAKMRFILPIHYFTTSETREVIQQTKRGSKEVPEMNQTSGCQAHRPENGASSLFTWTRWPLMATDEGAKQLSVLFGKARATQTWLACEVQLLSPSSSEIIIVCSPPPLFFFFICFQAYCYFYASLAGTWINHCRTWFTTCIPDIAPSKAGKRDKYIWTPIVQCLDLAPGDVWKCKAEERGWFLYHLYQLASEHRIGLTVSIVRTWVFHSLSVSPSLKDRFVFPTLVAQSCNSSWMAFLN